MRMPHVAMLIMVMTVSGLAASASVFFSCHEGKWIALSGAD